MYTLVLIHVAKARTSLKDRQKRRPDLSVALDNEGDERPELNVVEAARYLSVSAHTVRRMQERGELDGHKKGGIWYFYVDELSTYKTGHEVSASDVASAAIDAMKASQDHAATVFEGSVEPTKILVNSLSNENKDLRMRNSQLERRLIDSFDMLEKMRTKAHERDMEIREFESKEKRKEQAFNAIKQYGPMIVASLSQRNSPQGAPKQLKGSGDSWPGAPETGLTSIVKSGSVQQKLEEKEVQLCILIADLPEPIFQMLLSSGASVLRPEQIELLQEVRKLVKAMQAESGEEKAVSPS